MDRLHAETAVVAVDEVMKLGKRIDILREYLGDIRQMGLDNDLRELSAMCDEALEAAAAEE